MSQLARTLPPILLLLCACSPIPPAVSTAATLASPASPSPVVEPSPALSPLPSPAPSVLTSPGPANLSGGMILTAGGHLTPTVGQSVTLKLLTRSYGSVGVAGATWVLDPQDAQKTSFTQVDESSYRLDVHQPGTIRVTATFGPLVSHIVLVATSDPAPGTDITSEVSGAGGYSYIGTPGLVSSAADWTRFWQETAAYTNSPASYGHISGEKPLPPLPPIDFTASSLVILGETWSDPHELPVIADITPERVDIGLPEEEIGGYPGTGESDLRVFQVPRLSPTAVLNYDCRAVVCGPAVVPPSPDGLWQLGNARLLLDQPIDLPAVNLGVPLTWSLGARTASRATLVGNHLVPTAPGGLVLQVSDGNHTGVMLDAIAASEDFDAPVGDGGSFAATLNGPQLVNSQADWTRLWATFFGGAGFEHLLDESPPNPFPSTVVAVQLPSADMPTTAPRPGPTPPLPQIDFLTRSILAINVAGGSPPVVTSVDGMTVHLVIPQPLPSQPAASSSPAPSSDPSQSAFQPAYLFNLPKLTGVPNVVFEPFPEGQP